MKNKERIEGYDFEYDTENKLYQCRGRVCYDEEHDEVPEYGLWMAAEALEQKLKNQGIDAEANHSEKGWVEVNIIS
jgi:dsDNA-binding SOS-regulon protein